MEDKLPYTYISLTEFNEKVKEFSKTNVLLNSLLENKYRTWRELPEHLIQDLFKKLGCKPIIYK